MAGMVQHGRAVQRRRTRNAIVEATSRLLAAGADPSVNDIAEAADVSRRTVYMHFPTLDHLLLDATLGAMNTDVDTALSTMADVDVRTRLTLLVDAVSRSIAESLPLGRKLIKLTVDTPVPDGAPKRGYRRIQWIEHALDPVRAPLGPDRFERLVSAVALLISFEAFIVLFDVRGLDIDEAREVVLSTARAILEAALADAGPTG